MATTNNFPIKDRLVWITDKKTGVKYQERRQCQYDPKSKFNRTIKSERTGLKMLPGSDEPVLCRPKRKPGEAARAAEATAAGQTQASRTRTGASDIVSWASKISGLRDVVRSTFPAGVADKILSIAMFMVMTGDALHNIESWQLEHDLPYEEGLSGDSCYELFEELGLDESGMQELFRRLAGLAGPGTPVQAFDSTTMSTYSEDGLVPTARPGYNKAGDGLDAFKVISFFSIDTRLPVSFEIQPGNIPDVKSLLNAVKRVQAYNLQRPEVVLENGFFSRENVTCFCREHLKFTIRATLTDKWIYQQLDEKDEGESTIRSRFSRIKTVCPFDATIHGGSVMKMTDLTWQRKRKTGDKAVGQEESKQFRLYYHYFINKNKAENKRTAFNNRISLIKQRIEQNVGLAKEEEELAAKFLIVRNTRGGLKVDFNDDACEEEVKDYGIFVLLSNVHSDPWVALRHYLQRNIIEQSYRTVKTELDGTRPRVWHIKNVRGKELCRMIALGLRFVLQDALDRVNEEASARSKDESLAKLDRDRYLQLHRWVRDMTLQQMLAWFDCVETVSVRNKHGKYRWSTESTLRDKLFLELLYATQD